MPYYRECPFCGAHLDPEEKCDCQAQKKSEDIEYLREPPACLERYSSGREGEERK